MASALPSIAELRRLALGIGQAIGPVESVGMALQRRDEPLTAGELGQLVVLAKEAHACADLLHMYGSSIEERVLKGAWSV
jgi:hypothetical protein